MYLEILRNKIIIGYMVYTIYIETDKTNQYCGFLPEKPTDKMFI